MTLILLFACIVTPVRISFYSRENGLKWLVIDTVVDFFFLIDMCVIFNTAYYDLDFNIIENRKTIAKEYLRTWFMIDFIAVIPVEFIFGTSNFNEFVRIARTSRLYKLIKLVKLLRMMKVVNDKNSAMKHV